MTKNTKVMLGAGCGCLAIGAVVVIVGGLFLMNYVEGSLDESTRSFEIEGREFGKATDRQGCLTEALRRSRSSKLLDLVDATSNKVFINACFETSRSAPDFCEGVPSSLSLNGTKWDEDQCRSAGLDPYRTGCSHVFNSKREFCSSRSE